jgi:hypothetical protein
MNPLSKQNPMLESKVDSSLLTALSLQQADDRDLPDSVWVAAKSPVSALAPDGREKLARR